MKRNRIHLVCREEEAKAAGYRESRVARLSPELRIDETMVAWKQGTNKLPNVCGCEATSKTWERQARTETGTIESLQPVRLPHERGKRLMTDGSLADGRSQKQV